MTAVVEGRRRRARQRREAGRWKRSKGKNVIKWMEKLKSGGMEGVAEGEELTSMPLHHYFSFKARDGRLRVEWVYL